MDLVADLAPYGDALSNVKLQYFFERAKTPADLSKAIRQLGDFAKRNQVSYDFLEAAMEYEPLVLAERDTKIHVLQDNLELLSGQQVFDSTVLSTPPGVKLDSVEEAGRSEGPQAACAVVDKLIVKLQDEKSDLERIFARCRTLLKKGRQRTGGVTFEVGLLNQGDTDGVVYPQGELRTGDTSLKIEREDGRYTVIKPHSFAKVVFQIKKEEIPQKDLDHLSGLISNHIPESYVVTAKTPRGDRSRRETLAVN